MIFRAESINLIFPVENSLNLKQFKTKHLKKRQASEVVPGLEDHDNVSLHPHYHHEKNTR